MRVARADVPGDVDLGLSSTGLMDRYAAVVCLGEVGDELRAYVCHRGLFRDFSQSVRIAIRSRSRSNWVESLSPAGPTAVERAGNIRENVES